MPTTGEIVLLPTLQTALRRAWVESNPGIVGGHEEGGFIVEGANGLTVVRWAKGAGTSIVVPQHTNCKIDGLEIIATFHTHPNTGLDHLQEPSDTDRRAVREDPELKG